jgi:hypothetical protein
MLYRLAKLLLLGAVLNGLCPSAQANTTAGEARGLQLAQTDLAVPPIPYATEIAPEPPPVPTVRIALLLPLRSETLNQAAQAVHAGFQAAHEHEQDGIAVEVVETGDAQDEVLAAYTAAADRTDIIVGPLSRSDVTAVAQSGAVNKPTIALTQVEPGENGEVQAPQNMLSIGLSVEDEARQAAAWAGANRKITKAYVLSTAAAWQRRAANAFATQWQKQGRELEMLELNSGSGYISARALYDLKKRVEADPPGLFFAALDARQARQVRAALGNQVPLYGTSQLNPFALGDQSVEDRPVELNGARLLDIPWQLQSDHPAVMIYPRPEPAPEQKRSADLERLYALGIDAYRVAREIAQKHGSFEIDGVTGRLKIRFGEAAPFFQRTEQRAVYRDGGVMAVNEAR